MKREESERLKLYLIVTSTFSLKSISLRDFVHLNTGLRITQKSGQKRLIALQFKGLAGSVL